MKRLFYVVAALLLMASCNAFSLPDTPTEANETMTDIKVPANFNFSTTKDVQLRIMAKDINDENYKNIPFTVYYKRNGELRMLFRGMTTEGGIFEETFTLPTVVDSLTIETPFLGLQSEQQVAVQDAQNGVLEILLGEGNQSRFSANNNDNTQAFLPQNTPYTFMGSFSILGVPNYLDRSNDIITRRMLDVLNASVPQGRSVPQYNPQYLSRSYTTNIDLVEDADIWITFIHEGAALHNALGYYSYPTNNPPTTHTNIQTRTIVFPNTSYINSGGGLVSGNRVHLGRFRAGTSIGWFLVPDGFKNATVGNGIFPIRYSDPALNMFTNSENRQHCLLLNDRSLQKIFLTFEDYSRPEGDNDLNDAVFAITANNYNAIRLDDILPTKNTADTDGDGVNDAEDVAPNDPTIAYENFSPARGVYGSLAFEDLFPSKGDYDLNDLVIDYNFHEYLNAQNKIVKILGSFKLRAMGGVAQNGFGIHFPNVAASKVASIVGYNIENDSYIKLNANGSETGQSKATMILFDNGLRLFNHENMVNTNPTKARKAEILFNTTITFNTPLLRSEVGNAPYNPFMIVGKLRGKEVHLPNYVPTDLMNRAFFGGADDGSNPAIGKYYKTRDNFPYAIHVVESFKYPTEKTPINQAYLKFREWAESNGTLSPDWYKDRSGYRNASKVY